MIEEFTAGMDFEAFCEGPKTVAAVERKLQVVSEAAARLGRHAEAVVRACLGDIRGIDNWLRHQYEHIELPVIWKTVRDDLPPLRAAVSCALSAPPADPKGPSLN
jgi:uncharacterized protein with HEPN domain